MYHQTKMILANMRQYTAGEPDCKTEITEVNQMLLKRQPSEKSTNIYLSTDSLQVLTSLKIPYDLDFLFAHGYFVIFL